MTRKKIGKLAALAMSGALVGGAAHAAPEGMLNKSVTISFSITIPARGADGSSQANPRLITRTIYVSSQGRVFARADRRVGQKGQTTEKGPGEVGIRVSGNSLTGVLPLISGATQLTVNFDPSFSNCTAQVILGAESGKPIVYKGLNGVTYTQTGPAKVSSASCSVRSGNAFAG
jgi:hypothetical protein